MLDKTGTPINTITKKYISSMKDKHTDIKRLLKTLDETGWQNAADIKELHTIVHKLSGSAGSYGFDSLSDSAMEIDLSLKKRTAGSNSDKEISRKIKQLLQDMKLIYQT